MDWRKSNTRIPLKAICGCFCAAIKFVFVKWLTKRRKRCLLLLSEYPNTLFFVKTAYLIAHNQISAAVKNNLVSVNYISCGKQGVKVIRVYIIKIQFRDILCHIYNYDQLLSAVYPSVRYHASVSGNNFAFSALSRRALTTRSVAVRDCLFAGAVKVYLVVFLHFFHGSTFGVVKCH